MKKTWIQPAIGVLVAIGITTAMDATGFTAFSALPLFPLMLINWYLQRISRENMGFVWGRWGHYGLATLYPMAVLSLVAVAAGASGAVDLSHADWGKTSQNVLFGTIGTFLVVILTEEGFFRGWLWASLDRLGQRPGQIVISSSIAFSLWHLSWVTLTTDRLPLVQIPVFILNAAVIGAIWGLLRWNSGSVLVASLSHGVWNGITYSFFGFGTDIGALGIKETAIYGPEVGVLGLVMNVVFALSLWRWMTRRTDAA